MFNRMKGNEGRVSNRCFNARRANGVHFCMEMTTEEKYEHFVEELKAILVEGVFDANMRLIETYHLFGSRIVQAGSSYGGQLTKRVAENIGRSQRTVQKAVQFARDHPDLKEFLSEYGKDITWNRIANKILVEPVQLPAPLPVPTFSNSALVEYIKENLEFLVATAEITIEGIHFFLPKDYYNK